jgi:hypothetical protein
MRIFLVLAILSAVYGRIIFEKHVFKFNQSYGNITMKIDNSPTGSYFSLNGTLTKVVRGRIMVIKFLSELGHQ